MKKFLFAMLTLCCLLPLAAQAEGLTLFLDGEAVASEVTVDMLAHPTFQMTASEPVAWKTSSRSRLTVTESGLCTPGKAGSVTLTAVAASGEKQSVSVRLVRAVQEIALSGAQELTAGQSACLSAKVSPANATERGLIWSSSNPEVLTVASNGSVRAQQVTSAQQVIVTAQAKDGRGAQAQLAITVRPSAQSVTLYLEETPVNGQTLSIDLGGEERTLYLRAVVEPADASQAVIWSSSSRRRATVQEGLVTGLSKGTTTLTATAAGNKKVKATCKLSLGTKVQSVTLSGANVLSEGGTGTLKASVLPTGATNKKLTWTSSNPAVLTVNASGRLRAQSVSSRQTVTITAAAQDGSGVLGTYTVTVCPTPKAVVLEREGQAAAGQTFALDLAGENRLLLSACVQPADAAQEITWVSSNKKIAAVSDGLVIGKRKGTVTLTARAAGGKVYATCRVTVSTLAKQVVLSGANSLTSGQTARLTVSVQPSDTTTKKLTYASDNPSALRVDSRGTMTAQDVPEITVATVRVQAQDGSGVFSEQRVTVYPRPQSLHLMQGEREVMGTLFLASSGSSSQVQASVYPADAAQAVNWKSSNSRIARVDSNGLVTCVGDGRATITAATQDGSIKRSFEVLCGAYTDSPYYIEVDKANQVVRVYERGDGSYTRLIRRMICSSGASGTHFENGLYRLNGSRMKWCSAGHDSIYMQYATRICGSYMFHGVPTIGAAGNRVKNSWYQKLGRRDSGGCIRLLAADAKWIYENVPADTCVLVMAGVRDEKEYGAVSAPASGQSGVFIWDPTDDAPENPYYDPNYTSLVLAG